MIKPDLTTASLELAHLYAATKRVNKARGLYNDLLAKNPKEVGALLGLADTFIAEQQWSNATATIKKTRAAAPDDPAPGLKLVSLYEERQDWTSAKNIAEELATQFPRNPDVLDTEGRAQLAAGDASGAASSFKRAYELTPNSAPILSHYIAALRDAKFFAEARGVLQEALAHDPQNSSLTADLIRIEAEIDGVDAAVAKARSLAEGDPKNDIYDLLSAAVYERAGRDSEAIAVLENAAAARPSDEKVTIALAGLYNRSGVPLKAEALLAARLKADPESIAIGTATARQYLATGRVNDSGKLLAALIARRPNDVGVLLALAEVAAAGRNWSEATDYLNRARIAAPSDPAPGIALVKLALLRQDWTNAVTMAAQISGQFPTNTDVLEVKGRAQAAAGDMKGAIATYKTIYKLSPDWFSAMASYVGLLKGAKEFAEAQTVLQAVLAHDPKNDQVKVELVQVRAEVDGLEAGLAKAHAFALEDPANPLYDVVSAELYEKAGRADDAAKLLEKAVSARPSTDALIGALSDLYARTGHPDKAEAILNTRLQADPNDVVIRFALGSLCLNEKKYDAAASEFTRLVAEHPDNADALNNLAWLYQQKGDLAKARELAEQAAARAPTAPQISDTLGWILLAQGEADKALAYLTAASFSAPKDAGIQYHLAATLGRLGRAAEARAMLETLLGSDVTFSDRAEAEKLLKQLKRG